MNKSSFLFATFFICLSCLVSCNKQSPQYPANKVSRVDTVAEKLLVLNHAYIEDESKEILEYIQKNRLPMQKTDIGVWYCIEKEGKGRKAEKNQKVALAYSLELLDGSVCYSSDKQGVKKFIVGKCQVERGLEEVIKLFNTGTEAVIIIPSYLAHGVAGDRQCITPRTSILYRIKILSIENS